MSAVVFEQPVVSKYDHQQIDNSLRAADSILKVVDTFAEAATYVKRLASRQIGGICLKGVVCQKTDNPLLANQDLNKFVHNVILSTSGPCFTNYQLRLRSKPLVETTDPYEPTIFSEDEPMHFDGFYEEHGNEDGSVGVIERYPLIRSVFYHGASHHMTTRGYTKFIMERVSKADIRSLARGQQLNDECLINTNPRSFPYAGEAIMIEAGDYIAFHAYGEYKRPLFVHGTLDSSEDRVSMSYQAIR